MRSTGAIAIESTPTPTLTWGGTFDLSRMFMPLMSIGAGEDAPALDEVEWAP